MFYREVFTTANVTILNLVRQTRHCVETSKVSLSPNSLKEKKR